MVLIKGTEVQLLFSCDAVSLPQVKQEFVAASFLGRFSDVTFDKEMLRDEG